MCKRGVVFDFDGVIINSIEVQKLAFFKSYKEVVGSGEPPFEEFLSYSGNSLNNILTIMKLPHEMLPLYVEISKKNINKVAVHPGMKELIVELRKRNFKCGLLTGKDRERTIELLHYLGLFEYFSSIVCSDDITNPKPHHEGLEVCISVMGLSKEKVIMVGDAKNDIICAKNAGVKSIGVGWGDTPVQSLLEESPDFLVYNYRELKDVIDKSLSYLM